MSLLDYPDMRTLPVPREQYVDMALDTLDWDLLTQDYVEVIGVLHPGWLTVNIKHWAKKPYKVTQVCP